MDSLNIITDINNIQSIHLNENSKPITENALSAHTFDLKMHNANLNSSIENLSDFITELHMFSCKLCAFLCTKQQDIYKHILNYHSNQNVDSRIRLKCPGCSNVFYTETSLESHLLNDHLMSEDDIKIVLKSKYVFNDKQEVLNNIQEAITQVDNHILNINHNIEANDKVEVSLDICGLNSHENLYIAVNECKVKQNINDHIINKSTDNMNMSMNNDCKTEMNTDVVTSYENSTVKVLKVILPKQSTTHSNSITNLNSKIFPKTEPKKIKKNKNIVVKKKISDNKIGENEDMQAVKQSLCSIKTLTDSALGYADQKQKKQFKCMINNCQVKMRESTNMDYHKRCHGPSNSLVCPECNNNFVSWALLSGHLWRIHRLDLELYICDMCEYRTPSLARLNSIHRLTHSNERPFLCAICAKAFKNRKQLHNHEATVHRKRGSMVNATNHLCSTCGRGFGDARQLRLHVASTHERLRPFLCGHCGYRSSSRTGVRLHERRHTGERPYACNECLFRTADHNSLRRHVLTHGGRRPYSCAICNYSCIQSSTFKLHLKNKHPQFEPDVVFSCPHCSYRALRHEAYVTHLSKHQDIDNETQKRSKTEKNISADPLLSAQNNVQHKNFLSESIGQFNLVIDDNTELKTKQNSFKEELKIEVIEEKLRVDNTEIRDAKCQKF